MVLTAILPSAHNQDGLPTSSHNSVATWSLETVFERRTPRIRLDFRREALDEISIEDEDEDEDDECP